MREKIYLDFNIEYSEEIDTLISSVLNCDDNQSLKDEVSKEEVNEFLEHFGIVGR